MDAGADIEARAENGFTPLHEAAENNEKPEVVALLLERGANIEARYPGGWTPLHQAAGYSKTSAIVELLIGKGANANVSSYGGQTPFDLIKENEYLQDTKAYWLLNEAQYQ